MLEITILTEAKPFKWTQEREKDGKPAKPIEWEVMVLPADGLTRAKNPYYQELGRACVTAITRCECDGAPVSVRRDDGALKPATDPNIRAAVVVGFEGLAAACGKEAERLGQVVEVERGNS